MARPKVETYKTPARRDFPNRRSLDLTDQQVIDINEFRHSRQYKTQMDALRYVMQLGLEQVRLHDTALPIIYPHIPKDGKVILSPNNTPPTA